jgi:membrane fusion protein (multidrug efflux system)
MKIFLSILTLVVLCGCERAAAPPPKAAPAAPIDVKVAQPHRGEITRSISLPATIAPFQEATLFAKVGGYLKTIAVDKGDSVKAGDLLAELEVPELIADLAKFKADLELADIENRRVIDAQKRAPDLVVAQSLDTARGKLAVAKANLQRAETLLSFAKITAPFAGVITWRGVDPGAFIPAAQGSGVVRVTDFSKVRVQVAVPEPETPLIKPGLPVKLKIAELPKSEFVGSVTRQSYSLDPATRTMLAEIELPNEKSELRPGMFCTVSIGVERKADALLVPIAALLQEKNGASVFKEMNGAAKKTPVKPGFVDGNSAEILDGVSADDRVILIGKQTLADKQPVRVVEDK